MIPEPVREVLTGLATGGFEAFLVGGCVRDLLLGKIPKDFDIATRALPGDVQKLFRKVIPTGIEHGTVTVLSHGIPVEVTTYRYESGYEDGRRPTRIEFHHDIEEDLARRDFTINAIAFNPLTRTLKDPFDGQGDLRAHVVRCVGVAAERFGEDGLRALRAVRIATVLEFVLDSQTEAAIRPAIPVFRKVALERVHDEFVKLLTARDGERGLGLLKSSGLLAEFLPELEPLATDEIFMDVGRAPRDESVRLAVLLSRFPGPVPILAQLKFPTKVIERVALLCREPVFPDWPKRSDAELRRWMAQLTPANVPAALAVARALGVLQADALEARARALLDADPPLTTKAMALNGEAMMRLPRHMSCRPSPSSPSPKRAFKVPILSGASLVRVWLVRATCQSCQALRAARWP